MPAKSIKRLIDHHQTVKSLIEQSKRENRSPLDVFEQFLAEHLEKKVEAVRPVKGIDYFTPEEIEIFRDGITPKKGIHYFDGIDGKDGRDGKDGANGTDGRDGIDGKDGKDGENISPQIAKMIMADLLKDLKPEDVGAIGEEGVQALLGRYEKRSGKSLEKRLNALQDAVMRNYGGHGGSRVFYYDLSSQLDSSTKTFTIGSHSKIVQVTSSSAPFIFRPTVDFTDTATTITFTAGIDAPSMLTSGQSVIILMIP